MQTLMQFGQYKGKPIDLVPVPYLVWSLTQYNLRRGYPDYIRAALMELQRRLTWDMNGAVDSLVMPPMERRLPKTRRPIARREPDVSIDDLRRRVLGEAVANARARQGMKV